MAPVEEITELLQAGHLEPVGLVDYDQPGRRTEFSTLFGIQASHLRIRRARPLRKCFHHPVVGFQEVIASGIELGLEVRHVGRLGAIQVMGRWL